jgi:hypothetical protein
MPPWCRVQAAILCDGLADWWWRCLAGSLHHWPGSGLQAQLVPAVWRSGGSRTYRVTLAAYEKTHDAVDDDARDEEDEEEEEHQRVRKVDGGRLRSCFTGLLRRLLIRTAGGEQVMARLRIRPAFLAPVPISSGADS